MLRSLRRWLIPKSTSIARSKEPISSAKGRVRAVRRGNDRGRWSTTYDLHAEINRARVPGDDRVERTARRGRGSSSALPVGPGATIHTRTDRHTYTQPATLDPWEAYSLILATFSPRFHYPPPPAAYRQNVTACQSFFFTSESSAELRRFPPKFVHIDASRRYFVYVLVDATIFRYREINARCTAGLETRVARFFDRKR